MSLIVPTKLFYVDLILNMTIILIQGNIKKIILCMGLFNIIQLFKQIYMGKKEYKSKIFAF